MDAVLVRQLSEAGCWAPQHYYVDANRMRVFINLRSILLCDLIQLPDRNTRVELILAIETAILDKAAVMANKIHRTPTKFEYDVSYNMVAYETLAMLDYETNGDKSHLLRTELLSGKVSPEEFVFMDCEDYRPELFEAARKKYQIVSNVKMTLKTSKEHTCHRCKHRETYTTTIPCRRADEQMPIRITCTFCGNEWMK